MIVRQGGGPTNRLPPTSHLVSTGVGLNSLNLPPRLHERGFELARQGVQVGGLRE